MRSVVLAVVLAALLSVPAQADVPRSTPLTPHGLGEIRVGASKSKVERALGRRVKIAYTTGTCSVASIGRKAWLILRRGRVRTVGLAGPYWGTRAGVRVGDPQEKIVEVYGDRAKRSRNHYNQGSFLFKLTYGKRRLVFETDGTSVTSIDAGARPEVDYVEGCA